MNRLRILKSLETLCRGFGCRRLAGGGGGGGLGMGGATVMGLGLRAAGGGLGWRIEVMLTRMKLNEVALMFLLEIGLKLMEFPLTPFPKKKDKCQAAFVNISISIKYQYQYVLSCIH